MRRFGTIQVRGSVNLDAVVRALDLVKAGVIKQQQEMAYNELTKNGYVFGNPELSLDGGTWDEDYINCKTIDGGNW